MLWLFYVRCQKSHCVTLSKKQVTEGEGVLLCHKFGESYRFFVSLAQKKIPFRFLDLRSLPILISGIITNTFGWKELL